MRVAQTMILIFFVHAHFLIFVFESEGQSTPKEYLVQTSTADDIPKEPGIQGLGGGEYSGSYLYIL